MAGQVLHLDLKANPNCPKTVRVAVYTAAYRKIYAETMQVSGTYTWVWNLVDGKKAPVARGVYYLHVEDVGYGTVLNWSPVVVLK
jgi:hypothetical protein